MKKPKFRSKIKREKNSLTQPPPTSNKITSQKNFVIYITLETHNLKQNFRVFAE